MFAVEKWRDDAWHRGPDIFWMPGPAVTAARRQVQKEKGTARVVVYPADALQVIETFHYVPPAPRDVTALTKEIFG